MAGPSQGNSRQSGPLILPRLEPEYVRIVGESCGVTQLTPTGQQYLAEQMTHLIRRIVHDAFKYTTHGRRARLMAFDIETAINDHRLRKHAPLGLIAPRPLPFIHCPNPNGEDLFAYDDIEIDLAEMRDIAPPRLPVEPRIRAHWLVFNGQVPTIPENVPQISEEEELGESEERKKSTAAAAIAARRETAGAASSSAAGVTFRNAARAVKRREKVVVQAPPAESLSVEQQLYFKEIVEACVGVDDAKRQHALQSLEMDTGVQALLPKLSRLIFDSIRCNIVHRCLSMLIYLVRIVRSISTNKSVRLDSVLHELIPSLLSCMLGSRLCLRPETDNHWALRDFSAKTLVKIVNDLDSNSPIRQRVYTSLKRVFDNPQASYGQIYGATNALNEIATDQGRFEMYNRFVDLLNATHPTAIGSLSPELKTEASKLYKVLLKLEANMLKSYRTISERM